jgi:hypothetical protein
MNPNLLERMLCQFETVVAACKCGGIWADNGGWSNGADSELFLWLYHGRRGPRTADVPRMICSLVLGGTGNDAWTRFALASLEQDDECWFFNRVKEAIDG